MPTSQRWPRPAGPREIGNATGVAAEVGVPGGRLKAVGVTVAIGGWGVAAGTGGVKVRGLVGDGVPNSSKGGVGERVTVAILVAAAVLVGELISVVAGVLVGGLSAIGV